LREREREKKTGQLSRGDDKRCRWLCLFPFPPGRCSRPSDELRPHQGTRHVLSTASTLRPEHEQDNRARKQRRKRSIRRGRPPNQCKEHGPTLMVLLFFARPSSGELHILLTIRVQRVDRRVLQGDDGDAAVDLEGRSWRHR